MATSTVFSFVTVRNPRKPTKEERETGFVDYDVNLNAQVVVDVAAAKQSQNPQEAVQTVVREFKSTPEYISDIRKLQETAAALHDLGEWLSREEPRLTVKRLEDYLARNDVKSEPATLRVLWNNLVAYVYGGGSSDVREGLITSLRAANVVAVAAEKRTVAADKGTDDGLRRLARATVLIPEHAHVPMEPPSRHDDGTHGDGPTSAPDRPDPKIDAARERLTELQVAYEDISKHFRSEIERLRVKPVPPPLIPRVGDDGRIESPPEPSVEEETQRLPAFLVLDDHVMDRLSETTRQVLNNLSIEGGSRIPYALKAIEDEMNRAAKANWTNVEPVQRVVQVGGAFWVATPPEKSEKPLEIRAHYTHLDGEYPGMYGDSKGRVKPLGIADFRRVEQSIWCYEPGEVAHIENVLQGESKERTTRRLRRSEEIFTVATEEETTQERDTQTADRFEVEKESSKVAESELSFDLGVQVTAQYGPVRIQADSNFANGLST